MAEPTADQVQEIRQQVYDEEVVALIRDTIEQLSRLADRLESHVTEKIQFDSIEPGTLDGRTDLPSP